MVSAPSVESVTEYGVASGLIDAAVRLAPVFVGVALFLAGRKRGDRTGAVMRWVGIALALVFGISSMSRAVVLYNEGLLPGQAAITTHAPPTTVRESSELARIDVNVYGTICAAGNERRDALAQWIDERGLDPASDPHPREGQANLWRDWYLRHQELVARACQELGFEVSAESIAIAARAALRDAALNHIEALHAPDLVETGVTDAEAVWCLSHLNEMNAAATTLEIGPESESLYVSWVDRHSETSGRKQVGELLSEGELFLLWVTVETERAGRACSAAYGAR